MAYSLQTFILIFYVAFALYHCDEELKSFQFTFPSYAHLTYARMENTIPYALQEFTLCHWARIRKISSLGSAFSYSASEEDTGNQLLTVVTPHILVYRGAQTTESKTSVPFDQWTHICSTWSVNNTKFLIHKNGIEVAHVLRDAPRSPVPPNGVIIIGQDQEAPGGKFDPSQSWMGDITEVHLWDRILSKDEISDLAHCRRDLEGNVISWRKSAFTFTGPVIMKPVTLCSTK